MRHAPAHWRRSPANGGRCADDVRAWQTVEPAIDFDAAAALAFALLASPEPLAQAAWSSEPCRRTRRRRMAFVCSWDTRDSVTLSTSPISRRVSSS